MANEPEVIQRDMEDTRHALAEKLEQIGEKISGTVDTVSEAVTNVTESMSNVTEAVEGTVQTVADTVSGTVESMSDTMSSVGETAQQTVEAVKDALNIPEQIRRNPWIWVGGSVALGFLGGKFLVPSGSRHTEPAPSSRGNGYYAAAEDQGVPPQGGNGQQHKPAADSNSSETTSMVGNLFQHFGAEIGKLKELALGTLFGVTRDMVTKALPETVKEKVVDLFNDFTTKAGGQAFKETILDDQESSQKGDEHESDDPNPAKMDRSLGAADRKGKATVGQAHRR